MVSEDEIAAIAKETLEANLRGVLATLTPEEVNEDRLEFAETRRRGLTLLRPSTPSVGDLSASAAEIAQHAPSFPDDGRAGHDHGGRSRCLCH